MLNKPISREDSSLKGKSNADLDLGENVDINMGMDYVDFNSRAMKMPLKNYVATLDTENYGLQERNINDLEV